MTVSRSYTQELLRGLIDPLLLFLIDISKLPAYGYQLIGELDRRSQGYFKFNGSTVYSSLRRLEDEGLVLSQWYQVAQKQGRRCYEITDKGRQILAGKLGEWQRFCSAASEVISS